MSEVSPVRKVVRERVADQIFEDLREQILDGRLADSAKLPAERELAVGYGVSGATVREAVRVLTAMGLVSGAITTPSGRCRTIPLLEALCGFLVDVSLDMTLELSERSLDPWKQVGEALHGERLAIVDALEDRDPDRAAELAAAYHAHLIRLIDSSPGPAKSRRPTRVCRSTCPRSSRPGCAAHPPKQANKRNCMGRDATP